MNPYIEKFKTEWNDYIGSDGTETDFSIMNLLWEYYSAANPVDDGRIRECEATLAPVFMELSFENSENLFNLICDLCTAYQRAALLEGIQIGVHLFSELEV